MRLDGSGRERVIPNSIIELFGVSKDGSWAAVMFPGKNEKSTGVTQIISLKDSSIPSFTVCTYCAVSWSWDSKTIYVPDAATAGYYAASMSAVLKASQSSGEVEISKVPGAQRLTKDMYELGLSPRPEVYAFTRIRVRRNLYSIPVR